MERRVADKEIRRYNDYDYQDDYDKYTPKRDLVTIHISRDQVVCMVEDLLRWMFRKIRSKIHKMKEKKIEEEGD